MNQEHIKRHQELCNDKKLEAKDGEWKHEPDRLNWIHDGLDCMIVRQPVLLSLCGYVGVPKTHPLFGKGYSEIEDDIAIHGGLTFANECSDYICHESNDEVWWFGFDCAHCFDLIPNMMELFDTAIYRNIKYVKKETEKLAEQLKLKEINK